MSSQINVLIFYFSAANYYFLSTEIRQSSSIDFINCAVAQLSISFQAVSSAYYSLVSAQIPIILISSSFKELFSSIHQFSTVYNFFTQFSTVNFEEGFFSCYFLIIYFLLHLFVIFRNLNSFCIRGENKQLKLIKFDDRAFVL